MDKNKREILDKIENSASGLHSHCTELQNAYLKYKELLKIQKEEYGWVEGFLKGLDNYAKEAHEAGLYEISAKTDLLLHYRSTLPAEFKDFKLPELQKLIEMAAELETDAIEERDGETPILNI
jgi:hypothetical protein